MWSSIVMILMVVAVVLGFCVRLLVIFNTCMIKPGGHVEDDYTSHPRSLN